MAKNENNLVDRLAAGDAAIAKCRKELSKAEADKYRITQEAVTAVFGEIDSWEPQQVNPETFSAWVGRDGFGYHWFLECPEGEWDSLEGFCKDVGTSLFRVLGFPIPIQLKMFERARVWFIPRKGRIRVKVTDRLVMAEWGKDMKSVHPLNAAGQREDKKGDR